MRCMEEKTGFYFLWCIQQRLIFIREMKSAAGDEILSLIPLKKRERNCKINAMEASNVRKKETKTGNTGTDEKPGTAG